MDRGADSFWIHPKFLTTPAHIFSRNNYELWKKVATTQQYAIWHLLVHKRQDACSYHCSPEGCYAIGSSMSKHSYNYQYRWRAVRLDASLLVDNHRDSTWMSSAIFRVLTFEKLSLTHTCCYRVKDEVRGEFALPTREEAEIIYAHERDDIELLDKLVAEFQSKWAAFNKPFVTFMNRVWKPRMKEVYQERETDEQVYKAELLRIGVTLEDPDEDEDSDMSEDSDSDSNSDYPDIYDSEGDSEGWYTTDEEN